MEIEAPGRPILDFGAAGTCLRVAADPMLCNSGHTLFGGVQAALAIAAIERAASTPLRSLSIQFLAPVWKGDACSCVAAPLQLGRMLGHWAASGRSEGDRGESLAFEARGITSRRTLGTLDTAKPHGGTRFRPDARVRGDARSISERFEWRYDASLAAASHHDRPRAATWVRIPGIVPRRAADIALFADWIPSAVAGRYPRLRRGTTLLMDLHLSGHEPASEWLRQEIDLGIVGTDYAAGRIDLFDETDRLIATSTQAFRPLP